MRSLLGFGIGTVCVAVTATGCTSVQSSDLKTAGMSATMTVAADDTGFTTTTVALNVDDNGTDFVTLSPGDSLVATAAASASQPLAQDSFLGEVNYVARFGGESGGGTPYVVSFNRTNDQSAPSSTCTLPVPFAISSPAPEAAFSRSSSDIAITYAPSGTGDAVSYGVQGDCVSQIASASVVGDPGVIVIPRGTLIAAQGGQGSAQSGLCNATITVVRQRSGAIDPHFAGGTIVAQQVRQLMVASGP
jgi:hypothetical protein